MTRPTIDEIAMEIAYVWSKRSTCLRRSVGCVLLDAKGRILSTGYNGVARGLPHCNESLVVGVYPNACSGSGSASGTNLDGCQAIHAEQNALIACWDPDAIEAAICTTAPCLTCVKMLAQTGCQRIVYSEEYPHTEAQTYWVKQLGRAWKKL